MIRWMTRTITALFIYLCVGTLLAEVVLVGAFAMQWKVDRTRLIQILAIAQGIDLVALKEETQKDKDEVSYEQVSYEEILKTRSENSLHLQLREQALDSGLGMVARETRKLASNMKRNRAIETSLNDRVAATRQEAIDGGGANLRALVETLKAKAAYQILSTMLENDEVQEVVTLLANMPVNKSSKIVYEFVKAGEDEALYEVLTEMRKGYPEAQIAEDIQGQLAEPGGGKP